MNVEPVTLGEGLRNAGFDLRSKTGKDGESRSDARSHSYGRNSLDHDVPLSLGLCGPPLAWLITQRPFPDVFAKAENGFVPPEFCFVAGHARNMIGMPRGTPRAARR